MPYIPLTAVKGTILIKKIWWIKIYQKSHVIDSLLLPTPGSQLNFFIFYKLLEISKTLTLMRLEDTV